MARIPDTDTTPARIYAAWEARETRHGRAHLGASQIGRPCERETWYAFRWTLPPVYEGRMLRLFDRGKREEAVLVADLRAAGAEVHEVDPSTGRQFQFADLGGHFGGSMDACAAGLPEAPKTWHVVELKTHNHASFSALSREGVAVAHPEHFAQMQLYMGWSGMDRALYLAVDKDTDALYAERVEFDRSVFSRLVEKARRIVFSNEPPPRIADAPDHFRCARCLFRTVCHEGALPRVNCRTCAHSTPREDGTWHCARHDRTLSVDDQRAGCPQHLYLPPIMPFTPLQARPGWVCYQHGDDHFFNAEEGADTPNDGPRFASRELESLTTDQMVAVIETKRAFGGRITHAS